VPIDAKARQVAAPSAIRAPLGTAPIGCFCFVVEGNKMGIVIKHYTSSPLSWLLWAPFLGILAWQAGLIFLAAAAWARALRPRWVIGLFALGLVLPFTGIPWMFLGCLYGLAVGCGLAVRRGWRWGYGVLILGLFGTMVLQFGLRAERMRELHDAFSIPATWRTP
jgi:hypothetical protein